MTDRFVLYDEVSARHYAADDTFMPDALSKEDGNLLRFGNDGGIFIDANDILSNQAGNALGISSIDQRVYYAGGGNGSGTINIADYISGIACNKIVVSGGLLHVLAADMLSDEAGQLLHIDSDCEILLTASDLVSTNSGNTITVGSDSKLFVPASSAAAVQQEFCPAMTAEPGLNISWTIISTLGTKPTIIQVYWVRGTDELVQTYPTIVFNPNNGEITIEFDSTITIDIHGSNAIPAGDYVVNYF